MTHFFSLLNFFHNQLRILRTAHCAGELVKLPPSSPAGPWAPAWFFLNSLWSHSDLSEHLPSCFVCLSPTTPLCRTSFRLWLMRKGTALWSARWWCPAAWRWFPSAVIWSLGAAWRCFWAPLPDHRRSDRVVVSPDSWRPRSWRPRDRCSAFRRLPGLWSVWRAPWRKSTTVRTRGKTFRFWWSLRTNKT